MRECRVCVRQCRVCVRVCVAYPRAILMLEMETNAEQNILLSYNKHSFILVYSTVFYCTNYNDLSFYCKLY